MSELEVEVIRSRKRKKTVSAKLYRKLMRIHVPEKISERELKKHIAYFKKRFLSRYHAERLNHEQDLCIIAEVLNKKYFKGELRIQSIEYVAGQHARFGSCYYEEGIIRISRLIGDMPTWVRDYVIMHELAHLIEPRHNKKFHGIVDRYPLAERARGFLIAKGLEMYDSENSAEDSDVSDLESGATLL